MIWFNNEKLYPGNYCRGILFWVAAQFFFATEAEKIQGFAAQRIALIQQ